MGLACSKFNKNCTRKAGELTFIDKKTSNQSAENVKDTMLDYERWLVGRDAKLC